MNKLTEKEKSMYNLKPCPFCGGLAHVMREKYITSTGNGDEIVKCHVECCDCGARGSTIQYKRQIGECWSGKKLEAGAAEKAAERWNRRVEAKENGKEKAKPAWMPIVGQGGETVGTFAFCPHCGIVLSQFEIDGKKIGETSCRNCGTEITWEGYPQTPGPNTRKREKPDDI